MLMRYLNRTYNEPSRFFEQRFYPMITDEITHRQVCKHFHSLVFSKEVWIALLSDLKARQFIDRMSYEEFRELSLEALVTLAKCITQGPSCPFPFALRRIHLHPLSDDESFALKDEAKLLPGGQYVLFTRDGRLRCWSVMEDRLVWEYQGQWESYQVREFAAEVVEDGRAATILLGICVAEPLLSTCVPFLSFFRAN